MLKKLLFLCLILIFVNKTFAQVSDGGTVSGFVYDEGNGETLIGANAILQETGLGASSNVSGYFAIPGILPGKYKLVVSYIGYKEWTQDFTISAKENKSFKIFLKPDIIQGKEVVVSADSIRTAEKLFAKPISKVELNAVQVNSIPRVIEADLLRSLQTLPGIQPLSDFSSALYVRGGTPDQNLYLIDGTDVYNPEHAFGLFSTFNTNAIKKVELSKGGFGADFGGRLSSVLNVTNLDILGKISGMDISKKRIMEMLELVGLDKRYNSKVKTFSHGMKQRLGIAQTLLHDPDLIILDEPTTGLDPQGMKEIRDLIIHLSKDKGKTIFLSSHILSEVEIVANRMIILNKGTKKVEGYVQDLLNSGNLKVTFKINDAEKVLSLVSGSKWNENFITSYNSDVALNLQQNEISEFNKYLVENSIKVYSIIPARTLEEYFLEITEEIK